MRLIVDSSVIVGGDWHLDGRAASTLLAASRRDELEIVVPEVVLREIITAHEEQVQGQMAKLDAEVSKMQKLFGKHPVVMDLKANPSQDYEADLRETLRRASVKIAPLPSTSHDRFLDRALSRRRPFDKGGKNGYRDALVWESVLEACDGDGLVFAARDGDFKDGDGNLHPDLIADLQGLPGNRVLRLANSLAEARDLVVEPAREVAEALEERMARDVEWRRELATRLERVAQSQVFYLAGDNFELDHEAEALVAEVETIEVEELLNFSDPTIVGAWANTEDEFNVELHVDAEAQLAIDVILDRSELADRHGKVPDVIETDGDSLRAKTLGWGGLTIAFEARFQRTTDEITEVRVSGAV